jgi:hypothetical protein
MANEPNRPDLDDDADEPTEEEIEREKKRSSQTWKHDDSRELSDRDQDFPLKP